MSEVTPPPAPTANTPLTDERQVAFLIYLLYLGALVFGPLAIAGLVLAYVNRETAPDWLKTHHEFQVRTFWIGLLYAGVSFVLCFVLIGFPLLLASVIWFIVRCALGLDRLLKREAYPKPESWLV
jgi:uncharacterized membrane protein